jgi:hypothetical protein
VRAAYPEEVHVTRFPKERAPGWFLTVKVNLNRSLVDKVGDDIQEAIKMLEQKGPVSEAERKLVKTSVTH